MTADFSNHELDRLTRDLDAMHRDLLPGMTAAVAAVAAQMRDGVERARALAQSETSRRTFLMSGAGTAAALGGGALLAACGGGGSTATATPAASASDIQLAQLAGGIELLAVNTYTAALKAASAGSFGPVPAAVSQFASTAKAQHSQHLTAWNNILAGAGQAAVSAPDPALNAKVAGQLGALKTIGDVAKLALSLEMIAAETYVASAGLIADPAYRTLALTVGPVEAQHVAILNFVIGNYPVPDSQMKTDQARGVGDLKG